MLYFFYYIKMLKTPYYYNQNLRNKKYSNYDIYCATSRLKILLTDNENIEIYPKYEDDMLIHLYFKINNLNDNNRITYLQKQLDYIISNNVNECLIYNSNNIINNIPLWYINLLFIDIVKEIIDNFIKTDNKFNDFRLLIDDFDYEPDIGYFIIRNNILYADLHNLYKDDIEITTYEDIVNIINIQIVDKLTTFYKNGYIKYSNNIDGTDFIEGWNLTLYKNNIYYPNWDYSYLLIDNMINISNILNNQYIQSHRYDINIKYIMSSIYSLYNIIRDLYNLFNDITIYYYNNTIYINRIDKAFNYNDYTNIINLINKSYEYDNTDINILMDNDTNYKKNNTISYKNINNEDIYLTIN